MLTVSGLVIGLALGPIMIFGSWLGKRIVERLSEKVFIAMIEGVLIVAGLLFLAGG